jgi:hypothetical protein
MKEGTILGARVQSALRLQCQIGPAKRPLPFTSIQRGPFYSRALLNVDCSEDHQVAYHVDFQAVRYCISAGFFAILWDLHHLEEVMENGANGTEQLLLLKTRLHTFMDTMKELLMSGQNQTYVEEVSDQKPKLFVR